MSAEFPVGGVLNSSVYIFTMNKRCCFQDTILKVEKGIICFVTERSVWFIVTLGRSEVKFREK